MSKPKRRRRTPGLAPAAVTQITKVLGEISQPGWIVSMRSVVETVMAACPKLSERQVLLAYDELCKPPFGYLKKHYEVWQESAYDEEDRDSIEFTAEQIAEAQKSGELVDPQSGSFLVDWKDRLSTVYMATDKLPRDLGVEALEKLLDELYHFRKKGEGSRQAVAAAWRKFADLHGVEA